jgi:hypothetical protein
MSLRGPGGGFTVRRPTTRTGDGSESMEGLAMAKQFGFPASPRLFLIATCGPVYTYQKFMDFLH